MKREAFCRDIFPRIAGVICASGMGGRSLVFSAERRTPILQSTTGGGLHLVATGRLVFLGVSLFFNDLDGRSDKRRGAEAQRKRGEEERGERREERRAPAALGRRRAVP